MQRAIYIGAIILALCAARGVYAEPIPEYVLQKDYDNCLGGVAPRQDPQRAQYCSCVRNGMRTWDADSYASILLKEAQTQEIAPEIDALAKTCVEKVLH